MPPRPGAIKKKKKMSTSHTRKLLSKNNIPIVDKMVYDSLYPSRSNSKSQQQRNYGLTEDDLNNLPEPNFTTIKEYVVRGTVHKPEHYIHFVEKASENDWKVEYDMDDEDAAWLSLINDKRKNSHLNRVEPETFELLMDRFEKVSWFQRKTLLDGHEVETVSDEDAVCCICTGGESPASNEILFCDMCNLAVHQECYGVPYLPEGQWLCRRCLHSPSRLLCCVLCPLASGAFKQTDRGFWCHILCAIWLPEVQFSNSIFLDPICCIERIPSSRWNLTCTICKYKDVGACIRCKHKSCKVAFHASCAQQAGYYMMMKMQTGGYRKAGVHGIYCPKHAPYSVETENTNSMNVLKKKVVQSLCSSVILVPYIPPEKIKEISDLVDLKQKNVFIQKLLAYWALKRYVRKGVPLIPSKWLRLQEHLTEEGSIVQYKEPNVANDEADDDKKIKQDQLLKFRRGLEKVRLLCELVRKREKLKNEYTLLKYKCLQLYITPFTSFLKNITNILIEMDNDNIFSNEVDGSETKSTNPTNFTQIKSKVEAFKYNSLQEYENDFHAMISNHIKCFAKRSTIYKSATRLQENSKQIFTAAYKEIKYIDNQSVEQNHCRTYNHIKNEIFDNTEIDFHNKDTVLSNFFQSDQFIDLGPSTDSCNVHLSTNSDVVNEELNVVDIIVKQELDNEVLLFNKKTSLNPVKTKIVMRKQQLQKIKNKSPKINFDKRLPSAKIDTSKIVSKHKTEVRNRLFQKERTESYVTLSQKSTQKDLQYKIKKEQDEFINIQHLRETFSDTKEEMKKATPKVLNFLQEESFNQKTNNFNMNSDMKFMEQLNEINISVASGVKQEVEDTNSLLLEDTTSLFKRKNNRLDNIKKINKSSASFQNVSNESLQNSQPVEPSQGKVKVIEATIKQEVYDTDDELVILQDLDVFESKHILNNDNLSKIETKTSCSPEICKQPFAPEKTLLEEEAFDLQINCKNEYDVCDSVFLNETKQLRKRNKKRKLSAKNVKKTPGTTHYECFDKYSSSPTCSKRLVKKIKIKNLQEKTEELSQPVEGHLNTSLLNKPIEPLIVKISVPNTVKEENNYFKDSIFTLENPAIKQRKIKRKTKKNENGQIVLEKQQQKLLNSEITLQIESSPDEKAALQLKIKQEPDDGDNFFVDDEMLPEKKKKTLNKNKLSKMSKELHDLQQEINKAYSRTSDTLLTPQNNANIEHITFEGDCVDYLHTNFTERTNVQHQHQIISTEGNILHPRIKQEFDGCGNLHEEDKNVLIKTKKVSKKLNKK